MKPRGLVPNFFIHVSVCDLYILTIGSFILLQQNRRTNRWNISQIHECRNLARGRAVSFLVIIVSNFRYSVFALWRQDYSIYDLRSLICLKCTVSWRKLAILFAYIHKNTQKICNIFSKDIRKTIKSRSSKKGLWRNQRTVYLLIRDRRDPPLLSEGPPWWGLPFPSPLLRQNMFKHIPLYPPFHSPFRSGRHGTWNT